MLRNLIGETAKQIFERTKLPNEVLGRIWNLADTQQRGELGLTEFMIAMHLVACYRNGTLRALPQLLPAGLYEAASRRGSPRPLTESRPLSGVASVSPVNRQFGGSGFSRASSPGIRPSPQQPQLPAGNEWAIGTREKETFDQIFSTLDATNRGFITGDQAVGFFSNSQLPEEVLAQIWDLADINSEGRLNRDEFAVAMFLIRQQRTKRDVRDVLPQELPPNLIPPSMRRPSLVSSHPTAPAPDRAPIVTTQNSAAEDLLGLEAFTSSAPQATSATGNQPLSSTSAPVVQGSTQGKQEPQASSPFKPFVPSLSFNQAMMAPSGTASRQTTGSSAFEKPARSGSHQLKSGMDDLLGDNDPEISKKLTQETADLANLSNQVSNLTSQMQEVKAKRVSTEQDLSKAQSQKRDFEVRLSQLRSAYEQEIIVVKTLDERLSVSRQELRKLEFDVAQVDGVHQNLQNQHRELAAALEADKRENATIKERIRQSNIEIDVLKPQLEKLKSDARQQKGLVAINKKQLATNEIERERIKREVEGASQELEEATREAEESAQMLRGEPEVGGLATPNFAPPSKSTPPATNMNPFLRHTSAGPIETETSSSFIASTVASPNHNAFDSFFGPSPTTYSHAGPPPTSPMAGPPIVSTQEPPTSAFAIKSLDGLDIPTPAESPLSVGYIDTPHLPPAPPRSRQITSSFLPLRNLQRSDSTSSSVMVAPPASRGGGNSGSATPTDQHALNSGSPKQLDLMQKLESRDLQSQGAGLQSSTNATDEKIPSEGQNGHAGKRSDDDNESQVFGKPSTTLEIPGAFPGDSTQESSARSSASNSSRSVEDLSTPSATRPPNSSLLTDGQKGAPSPRDDFNAAFEGFGNKGKGVANTNGNTSPHDIDLEPSKTHGEFPPITELGSNEDSDSESDYGFDDNFTATSPRRTQNVSEAPKQPSKPDQGSDERSLSPFGPPRPDQSQLPTPGAESSPPIYTQTDGPEGQVGNRDANQFPPEYTGLLPSRDILNSQPTSLPGKTAFETIGSPNKQGEGLGLFGGGMIAEAAPSSSFPPAGLPTNPAPFNAPYSPEQGLSKQSQPQPVIPAKTPLYDDFENEFGDLAEAKEADDKGDDEVIPIGKDGFDEFNPVFDSPTASRTTLDPSSRSIPVDDSFHDFESTVSGNGPPGSSLKATKQPSSNQNHDWDAMFASLGTADNKNSVPVSQPAGDSLATRSQAASSSELSKPAFNRGLSTGTEHDDPILKRLTGMGYSRESSLAALEKFDYNIDKVSLALGLKYCYDLANYSHDRKAADHLTSHQP